MNKTAGIILPTVLIFLFVFALLAVSAASYSLLQLRVSHNVHTYQQRFYALEAILHAQEEQLNKNLISCTFSEQIASAPNCTYLVNDSAFPVTVSLKAIAKPAGVYLHDQNHVAHQAIYYRIQVEDGEGIALQSTVIYPGSICKEVGKQVAMGRASWQEK